MFNIYYYVFTDSDIAPWADLSGPVCNQADWIVPSKGKIHKPLLERQLCGKIPASFDNSIQF